MTNTGSPMEESVKAINMKVVDLRIIFP